MHEASGCGLVDMIPLCAQMHNLRKISLSALNIFAFGNINSECGIRFCSVRQLRLREAHLILRCASWVIFRAVLTFSKRQNLV